MTGYRYPSDTFPGPPAVTVEAPPGWIPEPAGGSLMAFLDPASPEGFRTNLVISAIRLRGDDTLAAVAERSRTTAQNTLHDYRVIDEKQSDLRGVPAVVRTQQFRLGSTGPAVFQVTVMTLAPPSPSGVHYLVRIEGTCQASAIESFRPVFRDVVGSLRLQ